MFALAIQQRRSQENRSSYIDLAYLKQSLVKNVLKTTDQPLPEVELKYLAEEINGTVEQVQQIIKNLN